MAHPSSFTLHSLRRGGTQAAEAAGFPLSHIMALGTWKSAAVLGYTTPDVLNISTLALNLCCYFIWKLIHDTLCLT